MLERVKKQYAVKFPSNSPKSSAYNLNFDKPTGKTYLEFKKKAIEQTIKAKTAGNTLEQMEDLHWENLTSTEAAPSDYAIDNPVTLFPEDYEHWNLNKFTGNESLIHDVCIYRLFCYYFFWYTKPQLSILGSDRCQRNARNSHTICLFGHDIYIFRTSYRGWWSTFNQFPPSRCMENVVLYTEIRKG